MARTLREILYNSRERPVSARQAPDDARALVKSIQVPAIRLLRRLEHGTSQEVRLRDVMIGMIAVMLAIWGLIFAATYIAGQF